MESHSAHPVTTLGTSSFVRRPSPADIHPDPPSYEEAIGRSLQDAHLQPTVSASATGLRPQDFDVLNRMQYGDNDGERDMEEERDYEESRPLKMGRVPDTRAQYTFVQPNDTIANGKSNSRTSATPSHHLHHNNPHHPQDPHYHNPYHQGHHQAHYQRHRHLHDQHHHDPCHQPQTVCNPSYPYLPGSSQPYLCSQQQRSYQYHSAPSFNAPSAPPLAAAESSSSTSCITSNTDPGRYQPLDVPGYEKAGQQSNPSETVININPALGTSIQSNSTDPNLSTSGTPLIYAPPPFPPPSPSSSPPATITPAAAVPFAGIPTQPGLTLINPQDISIAGFERSKHGAVSCDQVLEDPYQLYRFFVAHNDRPTLEVKIQGHHMEHYENCETDSDGKQKRVSQDMYVEDFNIVYDLTPFISPRGIIYTVPDPKTGWTPTLKEAMERFADEENEFKEMHMKKTICWDFEDLTKAITHAVRSTNYRDALTITYPTTNDLVVVESASRLATFMRSGWTKALCFLTCVGVIFYPARAIYRKKDKTLRSEFQMTISTRDFYMHNYWHIVNQVQDR
ncbi:hypothetical protein BGX28_009501 [Mortierella sp. GBA30]|nr:hypothetical protein BGX28_009501 [Mortierella sp. GBA30]